MKAAQVPAGYVFTYLGKEGQDEGLKNQVQFLKIKNARFNVVNIANMIAANVSDDAEVGIIGKFALNREIEPTKALENQKQEEAHEDWVAPNKPTALPPKGQYRKIK